MTQLVDELVPRSIQKVIQDDLGRPTEELRTQMEECLKFLTIVSERGGAFIPLVREVDEIWHAFITQTRFYFHLCGRLPGGHYVHHMTMSLEDYAKGKDRTAVVRELLNWVPDYVQRYGPFTKDIAHYWAIVNFLRERLGMSLDDINTLGRTSPTSHAAATA